MSVDIKQQALIYVSRGWHIFPVWWAENGKCACGDLACADPTKHPIGLLAPNGHNNATIDPGVVADWWTRKPLANIGIRTGAVSGIFVVDIDPRKGGMDSWQELAKDREPETYTVKTGSGGYHLVFSFPAFDLRNSTSKLGQGIDIRGNGGYAIAPPSATVFGAYTIDDDRPVAEAPEWLLALLRQRPAAAKAPKDPVKIVSITPTPRHRAYVEKAIQYAAEKIRCAEEGTRNDTLYRSSFNMGGFLPWGSHTVDQVFAALCEAAREAGLNELEIERAIKNGLTEGAKRPHDHQKLSEDVGAYFKAPHRPWTDRGNAERVIDRHGSFFKFLPQRKSWLKWNGQRWASDDDGAIVRAASETARAWKDAELAKLEEKRAALEAEDKDVAHG